jgi:ABC-2 type transport system permease protein
VSVAGVPIEQLGSPIKGPTALGSDPRRFWHLTRALAVTEFKLRFFGSVLGYLWQLMRPLMLFGVMYVLFALILKVGNGSPYYAEGLLLGLVMFTFLGEATGGSVTSLLDRENLVRKIEFPRLAVPLSTVLTAIFNLALNLVPVFIFLFADGAPVRIEWLELPLLLALLAVYASGLAMLLSAYYVRYRDVRPIWEVVLQIMFYASPIFYTIDRVITVKGQNGPLVAKLMLCNPFAALMQQARHAIVGGPTVVHAMGGGLLVLAPAGIAVLICAWGYRVFSREAPRVAELL